VFEPPLSAYPLGANIIKIQIPNEPFIPQTLWYRGCEGISAVFPRYGWGEVGKQRPRSIVLHDRKRKGEIKMKRIRLLMIMLWTIATVTVFGNALAQVAGSTTLGVAVTEMKDITMGWSAKKQILGQTLYNEKDEKVGTIEDIIIAPNRAVSYAIVGAGGFAGLGKHDVAIPVNQFKEEGGKFILQGATKETIKAMPEFEYAKSR
jgi:hypothetical protein